MSKGKIFAIVGALVLALGIVWYFASPSYAMMQLRDAAMSGDEAELEEAVDFPRVRETLKSDIKAQVAQEVAKGGEDGMAAMGAAFAMAMIDPMIDGFINADTIAAMVREGKLERNASAPAEPREEAQTDWEIERDGLSRFVARPTGEDTEDAPGLVFERDGLGWKLVEIDMPDRELGLPN